jgi:tRNA pseudouridine38-40 synthase
MGSAIQPKIYTVQGAIEEALQVLNIKEKTVFNGRTDKNVHATNQIISIQVPPFWSDINKLHNTLSKILPNEIQIKTIKTVDNNFHARFSAKKREYRYIISTKKLTPFNCKYFHYEKNIDLKKMKEASQYLLGTHDFKLFSKMGSDPNSTIRTINNITIYKYKEFIIIKFQANAYLRSQIRMMVDFLLKISKKQFTINELIEQRDMKKTHSTTLAPPNGLYLTKIIY